MKTKRALLLSLATLIILAGAMVISTVNGLDTDMLPPVAKFNTSVENAMIYDNVTFDASSSYDPNDLNLTYIWDFDDSDGFQAEGQGKVMDRAFTREGTFTVTLRVENGRTAATASKLIVVFAGSNKRYPPVAIINSSVPLNGTDLNVQPGTLVEFNGKNSYDPNADRLFYEWKFSDGGNSSDPIINHRFESTGSHSVTLTITTETGKTDSTTLNVQVQGESIGVGPTDTPMEESGSKVGWVIFIIAMVIVMLLILGAVMGYLYVQSRGGLQIPGQDEPEPKSRFRSMQERKSAGPRKKKRLGPDSRMTTLERKEKRLKKKIDDEKEEMDSEMKSPFAGLKDILSGSKEEDDEDRSKRSLGKKPPVRGPPKPRKPTSPTLRGKPAREEDVKKELERETNKLESFLSDILASSGSKDGETKDDGRRPTKSLPKRQPRALPPKGSPSKPPIRQAPSRPTKSTESMSGKDIKKELKMMEEDMDKEISAMFKK